MILPLIILVVVHYKGLYFILNIGKTALILPLVFVYVLVTITHTNISQTLKSLLKII